MKKEIWENDHLLDLLEESNEQFTPQTISEIEFGHFEDEFDSDRPTHQLDQWKGLTVNIEVVFGTKKITLQDLTHLSKDSLLLLDQSIDSPVILTVNGMPFAQGEILAVDQSYGFRVTQFL